MVFLFHCKVPVSTPGAQQERGPTNVNDGGVKHVEEEEEAGEKKETWKQWY